MLGKEWGESHGRRKERRRGKKTNSLATLSLNTKGSLVGFEMNIKLWSDGPRIWVLQISFDIPIYFIKQINISSFFKDK
jgi:hypothetical protein